MRVHRRVIEAVPLPVAKQRALDYLLAQQAKGIRLTRASCVAGAIWPGVQFHARGGGAAASRILKHLERDGLVRWTSSGREDWGWLAVDPEAK